MSYGYEQNRKAKKLARKLNPPEVVEIPEIKVEKVKKEILVLKNFRVTFSDKTKYNSTTRTVNVKATNKQNAEYIVHQQFGSIKQACIFGKPKMRFPTVPSDEISILSCDLVDDEGNIIPDVVEEITQQDTNNNSTVVAEKPKRIRKKKVAEPVLAEA
jgi:hypothetical protein